MKNAMHVGLDCTTAMVSIHMLKYIHTHTLLKPETIFQYNINWDGYNKYIVEGWMDEHNGRLCFNHMNGARAYTTLLVCNTREDYLNKCGVSTNELPLTGHACIHLLYGGTFAILYKRGRISYNRANQITAFSWNNCSMQNHHSTIKINLCKV